MINRPNRDYFASLIRESRGLPGENEWLEFKVDFSDPQGIGEYISALSNSAALCGRNHAYMVWGVEDATHDVVGTRFSPAQAKKGNEPLESWLHRFLEPAVDFAFHEVAVEGRRVVCAGSGRWSRYSTADSRSATRESRSWTRKGSSTRRRPPATRPRPR